MITVEMQFEFENFGFGTMRHFNVIFTNGGMFTLADGLTTLGSMAHIVTFRTRLIRVQFDSYDNHLTISLEEFSHVIRGIHDEIEVKHKTTEVYNHFWGHG